MRSLDKPGEPLSDDDPKYDEAPQPLPPGTAKQPWQRPPSCKSLVPKKLKGVAHE